MASVDEIGRLFQEGLELMASGDRTGAEGAFRRVLQLHPGFAQAHANLGLLLDLEGRADAAEACYRRALELNPSLVQTHTNLGALLAARKRHAEAEETYERALRLVPGHPGALSNLGVLLAELKREAEAERCYRAALAAAPEHRSASFNLGSLLLRQGQYEEGWLRLESRDWHSPLEGDLVRFPRWQGEPLEGKSILIAAEGGHGDMIQFCRYAALIKKRGAARVSIFCHPGLIGLFARLEGVDEVLTSGSSPPAAGWDYWTLPLSLPHLFHTTLDTIPADLPYLTAEPGQIAHWGSVLGKPWWDLGVGLVWKGNPRFERDADRSLTSLSVLASLKNVPGIRFISLQKGPDEEVAAVHGSLPLVNLGPQIADFAQTAAVLMNLDLLITVDTAVAHLAGALGKPCWLLLSDCAAEWRWLKDRPDSPWYPRVLRLFRQKDPGDWAPVIADVATALTALTSSAPRKSSIDAVD
jgi:Flp pilus assembly protein TadD